MLQGDLSDKIQTIKGNLINQNEETEDIIENYAYVSESSMYGQDYMNLVKKFCKSMNDVVYQNCEYS